MLPNCGNKLCQLLANHQTDYFGHSILTFSEKQAVLMTIQQNLKDKQNLVTTF